MTETIELLYARKSTRTFSEKEITKEEKDIILMAAVQAPSGGNMQMYSILDITDDRIKKTLSESCDHQPFIAASKMVLVFLADFRKWLDVFEASRAQPRKPGVGDFMMACNDAMIAAQNAVVAADALGIGSCYIGDIMEQCELHRELFCLPKCVFPVGMLVFGYPDEWSLNRKKPQRCALGDIVMENTYYTKDEQELEKMFAHKCGTHTFGEWGKALCERKFNSEFSKEMTRSVREYLKDFEEELL